jgi:hypothetical protein
MNKSLFPRIIKAWLLVGTLDIIAACTQFYIKTGKGPEPVLKYIASAVFGQDARRGGTEMIVAGLAFHYIIALLFTVFFFIIFSRLGLMVVNRIITGILYGIFIWAVMNRIVVPMSEIGKQPFVLKNGLIAAAILIVCIGIPLALLAPRPGQKETGPAFTE